MSAPAPTASGWKSLPPAARGLAPAVGLAAIAGIGLAIGAEQPLAGAAPGAATAALVTAPSGRLEDYRRVYREALVSGQFLEAETAAKQLIAYLNASGQRGYGVLAEALASLAYAQRRRDLYAPAVANYEAAIELIENGENRLSASLVAPLAALAETHVAAGHPDLALPVYEKALHVAQVNDGPHTLEQVEILDAMVDALAATGKGEEALKLTDRMHYLYARAFAPDAEEVLPTLERKAKLLNELERYAEERTVWRDVARIVQARRGEYDLSLLDVYAALGRTYFHDLDDVYFRSEPTTETGETFLRRALEVTERNPDATWAMRHSALLQLADYYTLRDVQDKARIHYRRAWTLLSEDEERLERRRRSLERIVLLLRADLDPFANFGYRSRDEHADPAEYKDGYVVARFTVNDRGRTADIEIVDARPQGFAAMETRVRQAVRGLIYRPRYADGEPVATPGQVFRHEFRYRDRDLAAASGS